MTKEEVKRIILEQVKDTESAFSYLLCRTGFKKYYLKSTTLACSEFNMNIRFESVDSKGKFNVLFEEFTPEEYSYNPLDYEDISNLEQIAKEIHYYEDVVYSKDKIEFLVHEKYLSHRNYHFELVGLDKPKAFIVFSTKSGKFLTSPGETALSFLTNIKEICKPIISTYHDYLISKDDVDSFMALDWGTRDFDSEKNKVLDRMNGMCLNNNGEYTMFNYIRILNNEFRKGRK